MRVRNALSSLAFLASASLLASCNGGSVGPPAITTTTVSATDPTGDTNAAAVGTLYDVTAVTASRLITGATTLNVNFTFVQPVVLPAPGAAANATTLVGLIYFNIGGVGGTTATAFCGPGTAYPNISFQVNLFARLLDGNYNVVNAVTSSFTGEATPTVAGNVLTLAVPISAIGGTTGTTSFAAALGNATNPTDCVPNSGLIGPI